MKSKLKLMYAILIVTLMHSVKSYSQNQLELYNNTDKDIYACYAFYDYRNQSWSSVGWYKINPYDTKTIDLGSYRNDVYIHGESESFWEGEKNWGNGIRFCVDPDDSFEIRYADKINCDHKKSFSKTRIYNGTTTWTFNP